jgi:hypothetical protein
MTFRSTAHGSDCHTRQRIKVFHPCGNLNGQLLFQRRDEMKQLWKAKCVNSLGLLLGLSAQPREILQRATHLEPRNILKSSDNSTILSPSIHPFISLHLSPLLPHRRYPTAPPLSLCGLPTAAVPISKLCNTAINPHLPDTCPLNPQAASRSVLCPAKRRPGLLHDLILRCVAVWCCLCLTKIAASACAGSRSSPVCAVLALGASLTLGRSCYGRELPPPCGKRNTVDERPVARRRHRSYLSPRSGRWPATRNPPDRTRTSRRCARRVPAPAPRICKVSSRQGPPPGRSERW